jgi:hypothetical protein
MARRLCQFLLSLAVLYGLAVGAFSLFHYEGNRPDVVTTARELHAWVLARLHGGASATPDPGGLPVPKEPPTPTPTPTPTVVAPLDARGKALARVKDDLLPQAEGELKAMEERGVKDLAGLKAKARATLVEARDLLGPLLDQKADDPPVQAAYKKVMQLLIAVDKR